MITMGKITHKRIAGSSRSSAIMEDRSQAFYVFWVICPLKKKNWERDYVVLRRQTKGSYMTIFLNLLGHFADRGV